MLDRVKRPRTDRVLGIDGAGKRGWVGLVINEAGFVGAWVGSLREIIASALPVAAIGIDIPIGTLPAGVRRCADVEARGFVGRRLASSVFPAPPTEALGAGSFADANAALAALDAPKMSRQTWAIAPKVVETAEVAADDKRVFEVHPEVSFCALAGGHLRWSKKTWNGLLQRRRLLAGEGIEIPDVIAEVEGVSADDVADAAAAAWSARRFVAGAARSLPDPPQERGGCRIGIWY